MHAFRLNSFETAPEVQQIDSPTPAKGEALVLNVILQQDALLQQATAIMDNVANLNDGLFKNPMRGWISHH